MERKWTDEQRRVIELSGRNLLVSAAAGSGKTAVLVERIIHKVTDPKRPADIDRLLVVTFTNAAAAEMRERIGLALAEEAEKQPDNAHLQRQQTLLHNAQITTIHSFCLSVIRNYFHRIGLDPNFRVAEEGELKLLKSDVLDQVLEQYYKEAKPEFLTLSETIATGKTDQPLKDAVLRLFSFAMSHPWPEEWLEGLRRPFHAQGMEAFEALAVTETLLDYLGSLTSQWARQTARCLQVSLMEDGPHSYGPLLRQEYEMLRRAAECGTYQEYYEQIAGIAFGSLPRKKFTGDIAKKNYVQKMRNEVKDSVRKAKEQFFFQPPERMAEDIAKSRPSADMLVEVTAAFIRAFAEKKRGKNILDFNDQEHFALKILMDEETRAPSRTAEELRKKYEEIMIDEYQDSNNVQEMILRAVSGEAEGRHNIFMVGDVKQSIYRFRMARPELFMEKYHTYALEGSGDRRIDLHKNFRSRPQAIEAVNDIFRKIMYQDIGNITYDGQAALYPGAVFPEGEAGMFGMKLLVVQQGEDKKGSKTQPAGTEPESKAQPAGAKPELKAPELEARAVGMEIRRMMAGQLVKREDPDTGKAGLSPVRYSDIVILLRSLGTWADTFVKTLGEMGIPVRAVSGCGYFSSPEVQTALNLLKILDNPRQDIPMAAVLSSPIVGLSGEELAALRVQFPEEEFYQAALHSDDEMGGLSENLRQKLQDFRHLVQRYRKKISYMPIHQLLHEILEETGYQAYVYALPGGEVKKANLEMLEEKAIAYEKTSYRGLFHFIRYMDQLQKYEVDFPVAESGGAGEAVRIMSIHKSKGLEFPIVFVSGLGKRFNNQDIGEKVVLHPELGIGMDVIDPKRRLKTPGLTRQVLSRKITMENIGEELRVLYVALTRAKEKLILTGTLRKAEEKLKELGMEVRRPDGTVCMEAEPIAEEGQERLSFLKRLNTNTFLQFILLACASYPGKYPAVLWKQENLALAEETYGIAEELSRAGLLLKLQERDPQWDGEVRRRLDYVYPYEEECTMKTKVSVSELKHRVIERLAEEGTIERPGFARQKPQMPPEEERYIPAFMEGAKRENVGAKRGTAMHRVLECYDFAREPDSLKEQIEEMRRQEKIGDDMLKLVSVLALEKFLRTDLGQRMRRAAAAGKLYKEKPFVMGKPAREALKESASGEMLLIQGIIDVFFEEEGGIVLLDYKTDSVKSTEELADRYRTQMELYQEAIERALDKTVKEKMLYSFCLGEIIAV